MAKVLAAGYDIVINQKKSGVSTPYYPLTKSANVFDAKGNSLDEILGTFQKADAEHLVPDYASETTSSLRFLRNDNTWANIQAASTEQAGVVQLSDATNVEDSTVAGSATAVKAAYDKAVAVENAVKDASYVKNAQLGVATTDDVVGVATLDESGKVYAAQLPSYVDDVVDVGLVVTVDEESGTKTVEKAIDTDGADVVPETGKIYVNVLEGTVDGAATAGDNKTYRWTGTTYAVISETIALGETAATAFDGARGKVAYDHSQAAHAMVTANEVSGSEENGYVQIKNNGDEEAAKVLVYKHPAVEGASETNPHGTTAADVGLGKVENKTVAEVLSEMVDENVTDALGYVPQDSAKVASAAQDGVMSKSQAAKLDTCMAIYVQDTAPEGDGIWFEVVTDATVTEPEEGETDPEVAE